MLLLQLGCQSAQGYGIAEPMPASEIPAWIERWSKETRWHNLGDALKGITVKADIHVAIFSHQHWLNDTIRHIKTGGERIIGAAADTQQCQFERWYRGLGENRYGDNENYPFLLPLHNEIHRLAAELVAQTKSGKSNEGQQGLAQLETMNHRLIGLLKLMDDDPGSL